MHTSSLSRLSLKAADGDRTRDPELGKLVLYQLSYRRARASPARISAF
jgi:hypothetical protein